MIRRPDTAPITPATSQSDVQRQPLRISQNSAAYNDYSSEARALRVSADAGLVVSLSAQKHPLKNCRLIKFIELVKNLELLRRRTGTTSRGSGSSEYGHRRKGSSIGACCPRALAVLRRITLTAPSRLHLMDSFLASRRHI